MAFRKGIVVQLGMITAIMNIESAIEKEDAGLKQVCTGTGGADHAPVQVKQKKHCAECGEIDYSDIKKAKIVGTSFQVVDVDEVADVKDATLGASKKMITLTPHPTDDVEGKILPSGTVYTLQPSDNAQMGAYSMLHDTLNRHPEITMLGLWTPVSRKTLYRLGTYGDALVLDQQYRTEEIKVVEPATPPLDPAMQTQVDMLLPMMLQPFDPATYADDYAAKLAELLASREAVEGVATERSKSEAKVSTSVGADLGAQLAAMLAAQKAS